jgi:hypothetical protein
MAELSLEAQALAQAGYNLSLLLGPAGGKPAPGYGAEIAVLVQAIGHIF